jgi:serine/threonine-protein kinase
MASALEAAHAEKVVHRDIKPQNILIDKDGEPYLTDFGLARLLDSPGTTQEGVFLGTPHYASPEQAKLIPTDERSDLYSLGLILFEMATGQRPFTGTSSEEILEMHRRAGVPDPVELRPDLPLPLAQVILCCLQKIPNGRYQSAAALRTALEELPLKNLRG